MTSYDAIIIGAGHNGLIAAATLAKAGRNVIVLEAGTEIGGGAGTREFAPGFRVSGLAHLINRLDEEIVTTLGLDRALFEGEPIDSISLDPDNGPVMLRGNWGERLEGVNDGEAAAFGAMRKQLLFQAGILGRFIGQAPPRPGHMDLTSYGKLALTGLKLLSRGREEARDFARMALMNVSDILEEHLTDNRLKGLIAFDSTLGIHLGPRSPTSLLGLYYRLTGAVGGAIGRQYLPKGGMGSLALALMACTKALGVTIRTLSPVKTILTENDQAIGVMLASGEEIRANAVLAAIHPATALLDCLGPGELDTGLQRDIRRIRSKGDAAKLHLALDRIPEFSRLASADHRHRLVIAPSIKAVENSFNPAKYGQFSAEPVMEITLPSLSDPSLAPSGSCVLSAIVQYAPYDLCDGWETGKPAFLSAIMAQLERHAPGISKTVRHAELLVPTDIEARYRMPGGHWHHGELQVDQLLFNRPCFGLSDYKTPIGGLYLASAGTHPGGGISGRPGFNAARVVLKDRSSRTRMGGVS